MNLNDKTNDELDRLCAEAQGWENWYNWMDDDYEGSFPAYLVNEHGSVWVYWSEDNTELYNPTTNGQQAVDLLKKYKISVSWAYSAKRWECSVDIGEPWLKWVTADTPERAIVMAMIAMGESEDG